jgi:signal transduction histidine kinase
MNAPPVSGPSVEGGNILVVDDTPANLKLLAGILSRAGHIPRPAPNGRLALSAAASRAPELILLDVNMPDLSGFDVVEALKANPRTAEIPVIFVTVHGDIDAKETAFRLGAVDYITKPFNRREVLLRVETHLKLRRLRLGLEERTGELEARTRELEAEIKERERLAREKELLAHHLRQAHKMEALGTLVGGIAHHFNNILSVVIGHTELAKDDLPRNSPALPCLEEVETAATRARDEVRRLLQFSHGGEEARRPLASAPLLRDALQSLRSELPPDIRLEMDIPDDLPPVEGEPIRLRQVLVQLFRNAMQAMEGSGGILTVAASVAEDAGGETDDMACPLPGAFLRIDVSDTGHGIPESIRERIFDPYFTTRGMASHAGMGLSIAHGIVTAHGGRIIPIPRPQGGTTFRLLAPVAREAPDRPRALPASAPAGTESILLLEGDPVVGRLLSTILERLGYAPTLFSDPLEALNRFQSEPDRFSLAVLDEDIADRNGFGVAEKIRELRPGFPLLFCCGYGPFGEAPADPEMPEIPRLQKPVDRCTLAGAVRNVLDRRPLKGAAHA